MMINYNPYYDKLPVSQLDQFFGRKKLIDKIFKSCINVPRPQCLSIVGDEGLGKSSVLNFITIPEVKNKMLKTEQTIIVYIDFASKILKDAVQFYKTIHTAVYNEFIKMPIPKNLREKSVTYLNKTNQEHDTFYLQQNIYDFFHWLKVNEYKTIMILDNFEKAFLEEQIKYDEFDCLRVLGNTPTEYSVGYIIVSAKELKLLSRDAVLSGFYNIFDNIYLPVFSEKEILEYIQVPFSKADIQLSQEQIEWVKSVSGGYPSILRSACEKLFDVYFYEEEDSSFESLLNEVVEDCGNLFNSLWKHSTKEEKELLWAISNCKSVENAHHLDIKKLVDRLLIKSVDNEFQFSSKAFELYVKQREYKPTKTIRIELEKDKEVKPSTRFKDFISQL